jgi:signal transduction histidine kinase
MNDIPNIERALAEERQGLMLLRSQANAGKIDSDYLKRRLDKLETLLNQLATERQSAGSAARFVSLYEASRLLGSTLDQQTVLEQVMDAVLELTGAERGFIMLLDDDGKLQFQVARNLDQEAIQSGDFAVSRTITRRVVDSGDPIVTTNASEDPRFAQQQSIMVHNLRSIMATPLKVRNRNIGVVYVDNRIRQSMFTADDLTLLDAFAQQAAIAVENARLFTTTDAQLAARVEELSRLRLIDRRLSETLDLNKAMGISLEWAVRVTSAKCATLGLRDSDDDKQFRVVAHHTPVGDSTLVLGDNAWGADHPLAGQLLESADPAYVYIHNTWHLGVPVRRERQTIGLIALQKDTEFDAEDTEFVISLADRAAIAIENARLYEAVIAAKDATDEFVSVASHELKTPMVSIRGYADMILQGMAGEATEQQQRFLKIVRSNVQRMEAIVSDLTDVSRIQTGKIYIEIGEVDLYEVIDQTRDSTINQIDERNHTLVVNVPDNLPKVKADPKRLMQVMNNLVSNAYKYTPDGGTITIDCKTAQHEDGRMIAVSVQDTGIGMTEEELASLGQKFWRADNPHVTDQKGTGLGFAITKSLVELMDGELTVESSPSKGSTFAFTLPVA